jgi:hypothetical protein
VSSDGDRTLHAEDGLTEKDRFRGLAGLAAIMHVSWVGFADRIALGRSVNE